MSNVATASGEAVLHGEAQGTEANLSCHLLSRVVTSHPVTQVRHQFNSSKLHTSCHAQHRNCQQCTCAGWHPLSSHFSIRPVTHSMDQWPTTLGMRNTRQNPSSCWHWCLLRGRLAQKASLHKINALDHSLYPHWSKAHDNVNEEMDPACQWNWQPKS